MHKKPSFFTIWMTITSLALIGAVALSVYGVILKLNAPIPKEEMAPCADIKTNNPKIGVHTRLTDEVEEWKIDKTLQMVHEMGANWVVEYFPWNYIQATGAGQYDWAHTDVVVNAAARNDLTLVARLDGVPSWARPQNTTAKYLDERQYRAFGEFVYKFVDRYKDKVKYYIIWNEPNLSAEWGQRKVDPESYAELLHVAYAKAKQADPDCVVLAAGLAPTLEPEGSEWGLDDLQYLKRMYAAGAGRYFDMLAVHAYGLKVSPDEPAAPDTINFARTELVRRIMVANGDAGKKIMITEGGWNDNPRWIHSVRPAQRIEYTLSAYQEAEKWDWLEAMNLWAFRFPRSAYGYSDYYTFVTPDFTPKPIYLEVKEYATGETASEVASSR